jgi:hypothetical protein
VRDLIGPRFQDPDSDQRDAIFSWFSDSDDEVEELDFEERPEAGRAELDLDRRFDDSFDDDGWGADKSDGKRSDFVFPASDDRVNDGRGHFPLNTKGRAYSALAFANAYHKAPRWFKGSLKELVRDVCDGVKKQYPDIHVNWKSCVPGKQSSRARVPGGLTRRAQQAQQGDVVTYATFAGPLAAARQAIGPYFQLAKAKNNAEAQRWGQWLIQTVPEFDRLLQQHEGEPWANQAELKMFGDSQAETLEWLQSLLPEIAKATTQLQSGT